MFKAVIFDMDGVIIDSEPMHAKANVLALKRYNVDVPLSYCYSFIGSTTYYMCQKMVEDFHLKASPEELLKANDEMKDYLLKTEGHTVIPYIIDLIKDLYQHGIKMIIASSSPAYAIEEVMHSLQIEEYFEGFISGMQIERPKPAPDIFLAAAKQLKLDRDECVVIEDSQNGVNAAFAAGITCIGFINPNSGNQDLSKSAILVEGFDEIDYNFINKVYQHDHMEPVTILTTERLTIRELSNNDIGALCNLYQDKETIEFLDDIADDPLLEEEKLRAYIRNMYHFYGFGIWGVFRKEDNKLIGRCGIEYKKIEGIEEYEIGYLIGKDYVRNGYGSEAAAAVINYCFKEFGISRIAAIIDIRNLSSLRLAEKIGMKKINVLQIRNRSCYKYYAIK